MRDKMTYKKQIEILKSNDTEAFMDVLIDISNYFDKLDKENYNELITVLRECHKNNNTFHSKYFIISTIYDVVVKSGVCDEDTSEYLIGILKDGTDSEKYWAIKTLTIIKNKLLYDLFLEIIYGDEDISVKAITVKSLSKISKQTFDRNLVKDTDQWNEEDIRYQEIKEWDKSGRSKGVGYTYPLIHETVLNPTNKEQKIISKLHKKFRDEEEEVDLAYIENHFVIAKEEDIEKIQENITLPLKYLEFLKLYSPINMEIEKGLYTYKLFGAHELLDMQVGYAIDHNHQALYGWNQDYFVIGERFGDPISINLKDEPLNIYISSHGVGTWKYKKISNDLYDFLKKIS